VADDTGRAAFYAARAALPHMLEARWGRIINIASTGAKIGYQYTAGYCAAKHGLLGLTRALAVEVVNKGITVNAVCPGFAATAMTQAMAQTIADKTGRTVEEALDTLARFSPQHRLIEPDEVARVVLMLAGEGAAGITGQGINVDGGAVLS
jgi:NAD(P)-dependent dehydrogenase (short-subunit alcohol dehydrogenase family)